MCGFAGFVDQGFVGNDASAQHILSGMGDAIRHRGPDDSGVWTDVSAGIGLVHRRLAIVDLTAAGHQPMLSSCGRWVLVFNGEIYNHAELRRSLGDGIAWRGHSDTETLLECIVRWGLTEALRRSSGMFALALWNREARVLSMARDRLGEKPLYFGWQGGCFLFGSELKALRSHPAFVARIDRNAVCLQLRNGSIPAPYSIYEGIEKLLPGTVLQMDAGRQTVKKEHYWSLSGAYEAGRSTPFAGSADDAVSALDRRLRKAVASQMVADVPLGAFLSGGVDSSVVVSLMQAQSGRAVRTFSIGFDDADFNEAHHAKAVAGHLGTDHTELYVSAKQARDVVPLLPVLFDEPFSDSSQIPTFLVSQMARQQVTVALSGDGGDELFAGYSRYLAAGAEHQRLSQTPYLLRRGCAAAIRLASPRQWNAVLSPIASRLPVERRNLGEKAHKWADLMLSADPAGFYARWVAHWHAPQRVVVGGRVPALGFEDMSAFPGISFVEALMAIDTQNYLPDDVLTKVDRAAMGVSLETRVPMLDKEVVEFAWSLPMDLKIRNGQGKWVLRQVLRRYVPDALIDRPKMGFGVPVGAWLRGDLRAWAEALLDESRLRNEGFFDVAAVREKWNEHVSGQRNWATHLWSVLMFQAWLEAQ